MGESAPHPAVPARQEQDDLKLHGWVYHIGSGAVTAYNQESRRFETPASVCSCAAYGNSILPFQGQACAEYQLIPNAPSFTTIQTCSLT